MSCWLLAAYFSILIAVSYGIIYYWWARACHNPHGGEKNRQQDF
jgi:hypothetical protein